MIIILLTKNIQMLQGQMNIMLYHFILRTYRTDSEIEEIPVQCLRTINTKQPFWGNIWLLHETKWQLNITQIPKVQ